MARILTGFIYVWAGLFIAANLAGIIGQFYLHGPAHGIEYVQATYSPWNVANFVVSAVFMSPAIAAYYWRETIRRKAAAKE